MSNKTIYLLIGQKGSGKSFVGMLFEKEFGVKFIRVEDWAKQIKRERAVDDETYLKQVFEVIENCLRKSLHQINSLVFESTGLTDYFDNMLASLKKDFQLITIGISADSRICLDRVKTRDQSVHINISDNMVLMINEKVRERNFQTDFLIENENKTEKELVKELENIITMTQN